MRWHTVDYRKRDGGPASGGLVSRGFWLRGVPRLLLVCRLFGHRPVVDGYGPHRPGLHAARWVVCGRCGVRPDPQGHLDPQEWNVGARYTGPYSSARALPARASQRAAALKALKEHTGGYPPGPWPRRMHGVLGGQVVLGRRDPKAGFMLKVGNKGSEHTLAADLHLPWVGSLYLHTERFGLGLVHLLNGDSIESKVVSVEAYSGRLWWRLWVDRDRGLSQPEPQRPGHVNHLHTGWLRGRWREGSVPVDPRTILLGPKRYSYTDCGAQVAVVVLMPHGDEHQVVLQLQRRAHGRRRGRKRMSWWVEWEASGGIQTKPGGRGRIFGSGVPVPHAAVEANTWPIVAADEIAARIAGSREDNDWPAVAGATR